MEDVRVRRAQLPADLDQICALYAEEATWHSEQWPDDYRVMEVGSALGEELSQGAGNADLCLLVAEVDGGQLAGVVSGQVRPKPEHGLARYDGPFVYVGDLVVTRQYRRRGIGALLMSHLEQWASSRGASTITLSVHARNEAADALYRSQGFRRVHVEMRKDIAASSGH